MRVTELCNLNEYSKINTNLDSNYIEEFTEFVKNTLNSSMIVGICSNFVDEGSISVYNKIINKFSGNKIVFKGNLLKISNNYIVEDYSDYAIVWFRKSDLSYFVISSNIFEVIAESNIIKEFNNYEDASDFAYAYDNINNTKVSIKEKEIYSIID